ncbi:beta-lactamase domain protein [Methanobacterium lacus]|uniref:Beta-lactamase domain protein n=1 Tax=Methanobacterium lacus (strain AL-21) TaxID=877455 RepID=F0T9P2_METLA|nr:MBL fold metallo-hydrolase [Methanobacterium lacus]ADZ09921.1 beta-lactamase domain protein [Methanobacterium lacus]
MKIDEGIVMLEVAGTVPGMFIYPTVMWDSKNMVLVDVGYGGQLDTLKNAFNKEGVDFNKVNKVIITHQDLDHFGGLGDLVDASNNSIDVMTHEDDKPYIQGEKPLVRLNENFLNMLPEDRRNMVKQMYKNFRTVNVDTTLQDEEELDLVGGITVIHTPGHTPGHICLYHHPSKTLIVGDAMNIIDGTLQGPRKDILMEEDYRVALKSLKKLEKFDAENIITYHGGLYKNTNHQSINSLIKE